jgi:hypothetical protein
LAATSPPCPSPRAAIQRSRLWARVVMTSQAALARKTRDGQCRSPVVFSAFYIVIIVLARSRGVPAGEIGS